MRMHEWLTFLGIVAAILATTTALFAYMIFYFVAGGLHGLG